MTTKRKLSPRPLPPPGRMALSLYEAAALTGFSHSTLRNAVKKDELKVKRYGTRIIVRRDDLEAFLASLPEGLATRATGS